MKTSFFKALSSVSANISAAWFILAFVTPNFANLTSIDSQLTLIKDLVFGIISFAVTVVIENYLKNE